MKSSFGQQLCVASFVASALLCSVELFAQSVEEGRKLAQRGDFKGAVQVLEPLAAQGDPEAAFILGRMYARGDGVGQNFKRAFALFEEAAYAGHLDAAERLAMMYDRGDGVARSKKQAQLWRRVAVGAEPPPARPTLAVTKITPTALPLPIELPTLEPAAPEPEELAPPEPSPEPSAIDGDSFGITEPIEPEPPSIPTPEPTTDRHLRELRSLPRPMRPEGFDADPGAERDTGAKGDSKRSDEQTEPPSWKSLFW